eukprot:9229833-Pyramimonas_sp.AAC.1
MWRAALAARVSRGVKSLLVWHLGGKPIRSWAGETGSPRAPSLAASSLETFSEYLRESCSRRNVGYMIVPDGHEHM